LLIHHSTQLSAYVYVRIAYQLVKKELLKQIHAQLLSLLYLEWFDNYKNSKPRSVKFICVIDEYAMIRFKSVWRSVVNEA